MFSKNEINTNKCIKFIAKENDKVVGRAFLYLINNDLHEKPYGLLEDLFIKQEFRGNGLGKEIVEQVIKEAKELGCYKIISQSRYERLNVHDFYKKLGFKEHGKNFRMDLL
jgi:GNAT superfamily N-acetyltransferase